MSTKVGCSWPALLKRYAAFGTYCRMSKAHPSVSGGQLDLSENSLFDVLNWLRRALTSIRSLDREVFQSSNQPAYDTARAADPRGLAIRGLTALNRPGFRGGSVSWIRPR